MATPAESSTEYYRRLQGVVSPKMRTKTVLMIGCSAGSFLALKLAKQGLSLRLADFDPVELVNLCRTLYGISDLGELKVDALARRIHDANPFVETRTYPFNICTLTDDEVENLLAGVDLIIAGTDSFPAQALANVWSQRFGTPAVFIGVHAGARGGRVIWSVPGLTSCYRCVAAERYAAFAEGDVDATDLRGENGALCDIQAIDMLAMKVVLAILDRGQDSAMGRFFAAMGNRNEIIVRTSPEYEFGAQLWDALLSDLPTEPKPYAAELKSQVFLAMDSVWLATARNPECADCAAIQSAVTGGVA